MIKKLAFIFTSFLVLTNAIAQVNELPIHFGQYFNNAQINPAKLNSKSLFEFNLGNKRNKGNFGGIKTAYVSASFRLKEQKGSFHTFGLLFNNDKEGSVIRRNRVYLNYARHQKIKREWKLSAGVSAGMYNFSVKSNPVNGGASASSLDLNLGLFLYSKQTNVGLSISQVNEGEVQPFIQKLKLNRLYHLIAEHQFILNDNIEMTPSIFYRYSNLKHKELNNRMGAGVNILFSKLINIGASLETKEGVYAFIGVHNIVMGKASTPSKLKNRINFDFSYFIPNLKNTRTNINSYELVVRYFFNKKK